MFCSSIWPGSTDQIFEVDDLRRGTFFEVAVNQLFPFVVRLELLLTSSISTLGAEDLLPIIIPELLWLRTE
jgi:hypothetical protein